LARLATLRRMNLHHSTCAVAGGLAPGPRRTTTSNGAIVPVPPCRRARLSVARLIAICAGATATVLVPAGAGALASLPPEERAAGGTVDPQLRMTQNLVSPDARDAAQTSSLAGTTDRTDRRSPDARDVADGLATSSAPTTTVVKVLQPTAPSTGLDWGDAGIGAGALAGLMLIGLGSALVITRRRRVAHAASRSATIA
jgi:hypothetical protein